MNSPQSDLTEAQNELYQWIKKYMQEFRHSPSIRQMMSAMRLKSPAPIQSRLKHLQEKGWISWQEGRARTLQLVENFSSGIPLLGSIAAGGLIETFPDEDQALDINETLEKKNVFALTVNGDSMIDAYITDGDNVLIEKINDTFSLKNGTIVSALVPGMGTTLKYFYKREGKIYLEAANPSYDPIILEPDQVQIQGKLVAIWRKI